MCAAHRAGADPAAGLGGEHLEQRNPAVLEAHRAARQVEPVGPHHLVARHVARCVEQDIYSFLAIKSPDEQKMQLVVGPVNLMIAAIFNSIGVAC